MRTINRKVRDDLLAEDLNYPFFVPTPQLPLSQPTYFCALRLAILQLDLTRRSMLVDAKFEALVRQQHNQVSLNPATSAPVGG